MKAALAVAAGLAGVALAAAWVVGSEAPEAGEVHRFRATAELEPRTHLFGDRLSARVELAFDRRVVDPDSVRLRVRFRPWRVVGRSRVGELEGDGVLYRYRFGLVCLDRECLGRGTLRRTELAGGEVVYRLRDGGERTHPIAWPVLETASRVRREEQEAVPPTRSWRIDLATAAPTYRLSPAWTAAGLFALAGLVAATGLALLRPELRRALALLPRRGDPLGRLTPLERALALVERAGANGAGPHELRKALDRLALELGSSGREELALDARRLAWSAPAPGDPHVGALTGDVRRELGAAR